MDAETKRWLAHWDAKLDRALNAQEDFRERITRLEEARLVNDRELGQHRQGIEQAATCIRRVQANLTGCQAAHKADRARTAGIAATIGAVLPVLMWLASKALGF